VGAAPTQVEFAAAAPHVVPGDKVNVDAVPASGTDAVVLKPAKFKALFAFPMDGTPVA